MGDGFSSDRPSKAKYAHDLLAANKSCLSFRLVFASVTRVRERVKSASLEEGRTKTLAGAEAAAGRRAFYVNLTFPSCDAAQEAAIDRRMFSKQHSQSRSRSRSRSRSLAKRAPLLRTPAMEQRARRSKRDLDIKLFAYFRFSDVYEPGTTNRPLDLCAARPVICLA